MSSRCEACTADNRFIAAYGDTGSPVAIVGIQPSTAHPDDSVCAFALDLDRYQRSSEILKQVFDDLNREFDEYYWTNVFKCPGMTDEQKVACTKNTADELRGFKKVIALGNDTFSNVPAVVEDTRKIWHPAYVYRNRHKYDEYLEMWEDALGIDSSQSSIASY